MTARLLLFVPVALGAFLAPCPARLLGCAALLAALRRTPRRHLKHLPKAAGLILVAASLAVALQPAQVPALSLPWRTTSVDAGEPCKGSGVSYWLDHWLFRWFRLDPTQEASKADAKGLKEDLARVGRLARHEWHTLCLGIGFLLTAAGFRTLIPQAVASTLIVALKPEADAHAQHQALVRSAKRLALLALGYGVFSGLRGLLMSIAENRLLLQLRRQTFSRLLQQDIAFHDVRDVWNQEL
ncbi:unnamed protein product, partial [Effrenium voratum]